jgi:predicted ABC-type ATPase
LHNIFIIGGPNGAGKTTVAKVLLPEELDLDLFLNADELARRISPDNVEAAAFQAGRMMLERMHQLVRERRNFAFETTCSGRSYLRFLKECQAAGWRVSLLYLWLHSPEECIRRVAQRVRSGGHFIPEDVVRRRYGAGLRNMRDLYLPLVDEARIYDNEDMALRLIASKRAGGSLVVHDVSRWSRIEESNHDRA